MFSLSTLNCDLHLLSFYDILEDRVPTGLVAEYQSLLEECSQCFQHFSALRSTLSTDSDSELDNVSMVEGLKLCEQLERFKRKLHIIENPLLRWKSCFGLDSLPVPHQIKIHLDVFNICFFFLHADMCWATKETPGNSVCRAAGRGRRG